MSLSTRALQYVFSARFEHPRAVAAAHSLVGERRPRLVPVAHSHRQRAWLRRCGEALEAPQGVRRNPTTKKCEENPSLCLLKAILCDDPITKDVVRRQCPITCGVSGCEEKGIATLSTPFTRDCVLTSSLSLARR